VTFVISVQVPPMLICMLTVLVTPGLESMRTTPEKVVWSPGFTVLFVASNLTVTDWTVTVADLDTLAYGTVPPPSSLFYFLRAPDTARLTSR